MNTNNNNRTVSQSNQSFDTLLNKVQNLAQYYQFKRTENLNFITYQGTIDRQINLIIIVDTLRQQVLFSNYQEELLYNCI